VATILASLRELQRSHNVAIVVVHHTRKNQRASQNGQALRGSGDFHAWSDSALYLNHDHDVLRLTVEHRSAHPGRCRSEDPTGESRRTRPPVPSEKSLADTPQTATVPSRRQQHPTRHRPPGPRTTRASPPHTARLDLLTVAGHAAIVHRPPTSRSVLFRPSLRAHGTEHPTPHPPDSALSGIMQRTMSLGMQRNRRNRA
jgi:hypothetical protein